MPHTAPSSSVGSSVREHLLQAHPPARGQRVRAAQQQAPVRPGRIHQPPAAPLVVADQALTDRGQRVVTELDQVKRVYRDRGARQGSADRLAERGGRGDRDDLDLGQPREGPRRQPGADASGPAPVHDGEHLSSGDVHDGGHPGLVARPGAGLGPVEPHRSVSVFVDLCRCRHSVTKSATSRSNPRPRTCSSSSSPPATNERP